VADLFKLQRCGCRPSPFGRRRCTEPSSK
jgi:hypothetical protein